MSKQPPPAPTASAVGPCPTISKLSGQSTIVDFSIAISLEERGNCSTTATKEYQTDC